MASTHPANLSHLISVEEYLSTVYRPDVDYVDGEIDERNLGEFDHGDLQLMIGAMLRLHQKDWGVRVVVETRTRVSPTRFRIPDVCVVSAALDRERIITHPPMLCIEVMSPEDRLPRVRKRIQDFLDMGVPEVWIFDPPTRIVHLCANHGMTERKSGTLKLNGTKIELSIEAVFATLDT
jgi:Uma2 family endonuclease